MLRISVKKNVFVCLVIAIIFILSLYQYCENNPSKCFYFDEDTSSRIAIVANFLEKNGSALLSGHERWLPSEVIATPTPIDTLQDLLQRNGRTKDGKGNIVKKPELKRFERVDMEEVLDEEKEREEAKLLGLDTGADNMSLGYKEGDFLRREEEKYGNVTGLEPSHKRHLIDILNTTSLLERYERVDKTILDPGSLTQAELAEFYNKTLNSSATFIFSLRKTANLTHTDHAMKGSLHGAKEEKTNKFGKNQEQNLNSRSAIDKSVDLQNGTKKTFTTLDMQKIMNDRYMEDQKVKNKSEEVEMGIRHRPEIRTENSEDSENDPSGSGSDVDENENNEISDNGNSKASEMLVKEAKRDNNTRKSFDALEHKIDSAAREYEKTGKNNTGIQIQNAGRNFGNAEKSYEMKQLLQFNNKSRSYQRFWDEKVHKRQLVENATFFVSKESQEISNINLNQSFNNEPTSDDDSISGDNGSTSQVNNESKTVVDQLHIERNTSSSNANSSENVTGSDAGIPELLEKTDIYEESNEDVGDQNFTGNDDSANRSSASSSSRNSKDQEYPKLIATNKTKILTKRHDIFPTIKTSNHTAVQVIPVARNSTLIKKNLGMHDQKRRIVRERFKKRKIRKKTGLYFFNKVSCKPLDPKLVLYNRIFKTASTSINKYLLEERARGYLKTMIGTTEDWYKTGDSFPYPQVIEKYAQKSLIRRVYTGHFYFRKTLKIKRPYTYINQVREPFERILSHYHYMRSSQERPKNRIREMKEAGELNETLADCFEKQHRGCESNVMTRFFCGSEPICENGTARAVDLAKYNMKHYYAAIGLTEHFNLFLKLLRKRLPNYFRLSNFVPHERAGNYTRNLTDEVPAKLKERIKKANGADYEIYEYAKALFSEQLRACSIEGRIL